ncbi:MAG: MotA/TolQ/ExbB proton channel family protein [Akkermansiaceae bacterium]|jgi:biopolymer transport protein ExbB|nr:MotA/TolQ/ExbB proton channel family protein [Akkermansiaceae bacterium]MDP4646236.1 MotA/TolQ/ExbB proton channel family protein [Akkermansiaceae bacterium]MDP4720282.1 MotA/TolQ/ExbB proton channel family protein [Akkermansiaceae bacterium]MDP4779923.1 MotA/TolQ/ExbB proton channel family protein [Akkermansiaceae bacterium]MDP4845890.1 MotA/TolQ/ExbB proton channel family protein [Akkermansiaceae bacterium]
MKCFSLSTAALLCAAISASAQESVEAVTAKQTNFLEIVQAGGIMMYPLALISVIGGVLILLYLLTIRRNAVVSDKFMNNAEAMIRKRDYLGLVAYCHRQNESMARVTQKTLDFFTKYPSASFGEVREVAEAEGSRQAGMLSSRITYLADIGSIAPMVGLLGTVLGMIKSFLQISGGDVQGVRQMELAEGVSEALITTAAGLAIGIPALVFYSLFRGRVQKYIAELEAAATHLMALLHTQVAHQQPGGAQVADTPAQRSREDYAMPVPSPLGNDRPDLHGI